MSESTDLREADNRFASLVRLFKEESRAVTISGLSLGIACLAVLMAFMALNDAKHARISQDLYMKNQEKYREQQNRYIDSQIESMQDRIDTQKVYLDTHSHKEK